MLKKDLKGKNSKLIRGALNKTQFREQSESLFLTSGFVYQSAEQAESIFKGDETGFQYTRYANPTIDTFEKRMAIIDGSESCFATASGMAAVFASFMCQLQAGDHVVSATALFGSCREVIKNVITRYGIEISFIDGKNIENWKKEIKSNTKIFFFETPSNPCFELVDIEAVCKLAKANNLTFINFFTFSILLFLISKVKKSTQSKYRNKKSNRYFFYLGCSFGFGFFLLGNYWITISLTHDEMFKGLIPFALILIPLFLSLFFGLAILLVGTFVEKDISFILFFSLVFSIFEFLRGNLFTGFPWNLISYTWSWSTEIVQILSLIGAYSLMICFIRDSSSCSVRSSSFPVLIIFCSI